MKAISLWQPWASLIALGVKSIETRSWTTRYRGPLALHATASIPPDLFGPWDGPARTGQHKRRFTVGDYEVEQDNPRGTAPAYMLRGPSMSWPYRLPLGAIVGTCTLVDVVPVDQISWHKDIVMDGAHLQWQHCNATTYPRAAAVTGQIPYGDFRSGRFAWLLADVKPIVQPISVKAKHQGMWEWDEAA